MQSVGVYQDRPQAARPGKPDLKRGPATTGCPPPVGAGDQPPGWWWGLRPSGRTIFSHRKCGQCSPTCGIGFNKEPTTIAHMRNGPPPLKRADNGAHNAGPFPPLGGHWLRSEPQGVAGEGFVAWRAYRRPAASGKPLRKKPLRITIDCSIWHRRGLPRPAARPCRPVTPSRGLYALAGRSRRSTPTVTVLPYRL